MCRAAARRGSKRMTVGRHGTISADEGAAPGEGAPGPHQGGRGAGVLDCGEGGPTVAELAERYLREHAEVRCSRSRFKGYRQMIGKHILPTLGKMPISALGPQHVAELHYRLRKTPVAANDTVAALSRMLNRAEAWGLLPAGSNPCRFVTRYRMRRPERFLTEDEFRHLGEALERTGGRGPASGPCGGSDQASDADRVPLRRGAGPAVGGRGAGAERGPAAR